MTPPGELRGKSALVTGAGRRVGRAVALALGRQGMRVALHCHRSREDAESALAEIRESAGDGVVLEADLSSRDEARSLVDRALDALGELDLVVASAASFERVRLDDIDDDAWDRSLDLNLGSPFALAQRALPALRRTRGSIVFITCASATTPYRHYLPYVVSKGALRHLTRALALEAAPDVRVNAVAPGTVLPPDDFDAAALARVVARIPLGRAGSAEDVADAVVYLARAPFVTGQELVVDGGRTIAGVELGGG